MTFNNNTGGNDREDPYDILYDVDPDNNYFNCLFQSVDITNQSDYLSIENFNKFIVKEDTFFIIF